MPENVTCSVCGEETPDRADRMPHEAPYCDDCAAMIFELWA